MHCSYFIIKSDWMDGFVLNEWEVPIFNLYESLEAPLQVSGGILLWRSPAWVSQRERNRLCLCHGVLSEGKGSSLTLKSKAPGQLATSTKVEGTDSVIWMYI